MTVTELRIDKQRTGTHYTVLAAVTGRADDPSKPRYVIVGDTMSTNQANARLQVLRDTDAGSTLVQQALDHPEWNIMVVAVANFDPHQLIVTPPPPAPPPKITC